MATQSPSAKNLTTIFKVIWKKEQFCWACYSYENKFTPLYFKHLPSIKRTFLDF